MGRAHMKILLRPLRATAARLLLAIAGCWVLQACAQDVTVATGYSINEISYAGAPLVWMDNKYVLFTGNQRTSVGESSERATGGPIGLLRWNTQTQEVVELMRLGPYPDLCYDRGYIYVSFNRDEEHRVVRQGPLGKEQEFVGRRPHWAPSNGELNRFTCRWEELPKPTRPDHGVIEKFRNDHGFLEAERPREPFPERKYFLVRPDGERITTAFRGGGAPRFSEYAQGYVYQDGGGVSGATVVRHLRVLHLDGRLSVYKLPAGDWMRGSVRAMPVRGSIFMSSLARRAGADGGYLVGGDDVERIVKGYINMFAVSPDGCKVAMNINPAEGLVSRMAVMHVCKGRN